VITETQNYQQLYQDYIRVKRKENHLKIINDFALSLLEQNTVHDIVWVIAKKVVAQLGFVDCVIYLVDDERQVLVQHAAHGPKNPLLELRKLSTTLQKMRVIFWMTTFDFQK